MKTYVVVIPVTMCERGTLEDMENMLFPTYNALIETIIDNKKQTNKSSQPFNVYDLSDFMDIWNNEDEDSNEIKEKIDSYWFGYMRVGDEKTKVVSSDTHNTSVSELITMLEQYPPNMGITDEQNRDFIHMVNDGSRVILSVHKPIGTCNRTGSYVYPTVTDGYSAFCPELDEDLYLMEWTDLDLFNELGKVDEPLCTILKDNNDVKDSDELNKLKQVAEIYGYTFDINCTKVSNLRKI